MARSRTTIKRDSVFGTGQQATSTRQGVREQATPEAHQTAMWLTDDELEWLDAQCQTIRRGGWRGVNRSAFVRALVQATRERTLDLRGVTGEAELVDALKRSLSPDTQH